MSIVKPSPIYSIPVQPFNKDSIREMMVASANYTFNIAKIKREIPDERVPEKPKQRKRSRLNDLSPEEKMHRKKLKNREAAQNSRDKKKAYVYNLELTVSELKEQNEKLNNVISQLTEENEKLKVENIQLESLLVAEGNGQRLLTDMETGSAEGLVLSSPGYYPLPPSPALYSLATSGTRYSPVPGDHSIVDVLGEDWLEDGLQHSSDLVELERLAQDLSQKALELEGKPIQEGEMVGPISKIMEPTWIKMERTVSVDDDYNDESASGRLITENALLITVPAADNEVVIEGSPVHLTDEDPSSASITIEIKGNDSDYYKSQATPLSESASDVGYESWDSPASDHSGLPVLFPDL